MITKLMSEGLYTHFLFLVCCVVIRTIAVTRQQLYDVVKLFGKNTCILADSPATAIQVNTLQQCAFMCLRGTALQNCTMFNLNITTSCGTFCQLYNSVSYYGYNVPNCQAYQVGLIKPNTAYNQARV
jgi:hypothetical protein